MNKPDIPNAMVREVYIALERLEADPYLLAIVGSWRDTMDDEVLDALKHWNAGTFEVEMIATTGRIQNIRAVKAPRQTRKPRRSH
ncbi:MAG TPA: hypothetical protein VNO69_00320 [Methyloceanibacter sp.]|nr:hypothetical protein [Methyloceanibacter sp.]